MNSVSAERLDARIERQLDAQFVVSTLRELARIDTAVRLGYDTLIAADEPRLVAYAQEQIRPRAVAVDPSIECFDIGGNLLIRQAGRDGASAGGPDTTLLIQTYSVAQHHNLMDATLAGEIAQRGGRRVVLGQGVSQAKAHQAALLGALKLMRDAGIRPRRTTWWTVNNEGRSSHACTEALLDAIEAIDPGRSPAAALLLVDENMRLSVGNRGRIDIDVTLRGRAAHSSTPELAADPIAAAADLVARLRTLTWPDADPRLGGRQARVYKLRFTPLAPHTIPDTAELTIDRRLLPGDDPEQAVQEICQCIGELGDGITVEFTPGVMMRPATISAGAPFLTSLQQVIADVRGTRAEEIIGAGTFDAGGTAQRGIPTVMWGAGGAGQWPLGEDFVAIDDVLDEVRVLARLLPVGSDTGSDTGTAGGVTA